MLNMPKAQVLKTLRWKRPVKRGVAFLVLILLTGVIFFPVVWMVSISLREPVETFSIPPRWIPKTFTFRNYATIILDKVNIRYFLNSYLIAIGVTLLSLFLASFAGYGFSRFTFRGSNFMVIYLLLTQMIPEALLIIPYFLIMTTTKLYDTYWALVISDSCIVLPFCILMFRSCFDTIPVEIEDAAQIDGCSRVGTFARVTLPLSGPAILSTGIFAFLLGWNEFLYAYTLVSRKEMRTVTVAIAGLIGQFTSKWNLMMAFSVTALIPLVVFFAFFQKYLMRGVVSGVPMK